MSVWLSLLSLFAWACAVLVLLAAYARALKRARDEVAHVLNNKRVQLGPNKTLRLLINVLVSEFMRQFRRRLTDDLGRPLSPCGTLRSLCDLVPGPILRKRVTKMVADQEDHIVDMLTQGRHRAAQINRVATWFLFFLYIFEGILLALVPFRQKRSE